MSNVCPTGLFFETQSIEEGLFKPVSSLQTHKHPSVCLQRKGDQSWICMRMRSLGRRRPGPSKAAVAGRPGGLCSSTCSPPRPDGARPELLAHRAHCPWVTPRLPRGPRLAARGPPLACPRGLRFPIGRPAVGQARGAGRADEGTPNPAVVEELHSHDAKLETGRRVGFTFSQDSGLKTHLREKRDPGSRSRTEDRAGSPRLSCRSLKSTDSPGSGARPCTFLKMRKFG